MVYNDYRSPEDDDQSVILPGSPWTYENNSINPHLQPSNATRQRTTAAPPPIANVPPYHPDYVEPTSTTTLSSTLADMVNSGYSSSSDIDSDEERYGKENGQGKGKEHGKGNPRVRRGSEGYEIQSADREVLFQEYIRSQGDNPRKYNFYEPEPHSDSESEGEGEELEEEDPEEFEPLSRQHEGTVVPQAA